MTGSFRFIVAYLLIRLLRELTAGTIISFDSMNDYYEVSLKAPSGEGLCSLLGKHIFVEVNLSDKSLLKQVFNH